MLKAFTFFLSHLILIFFPPKSIEHTLQVRTRNSSHAAAIVCFIQTMIHNEYLIGGLIPSFIWSFAESFSPSARAALFEPRAPRCRKIHIAEKARWKVWVHWCVFALLQTYTHNNITYYAEHLGFISSTITNKLNDLLMNIREKIEPKV